MSAAYTVEEGELTRIGQIMVSGLTATKPYVVARELQFSPGDPLTAVTLSEARRRLDTTRIFDRVDVEPTGDPSAPIRDVLVTLREAKPWRVEFGVGYETEEGFRLRHDRLRHLLGTGRGASIRQRVSEKGYRTDLDYLEPWILGSEWQGDALGFIEQKQEIGYLRNSFGSLLTVRRDS